MSSDLSTLNKDYYRNNGKILLGLLPFWDPLVPPLGISCLKSYLSKYRFDVKNFDANIEEEFRSLYTNYHEALKQFIPENKRMNLYNIGYEVLRNHLLAYLNYNDINEYLALVKILVFKTFYHEAGENLLKEINEVVEDFYKNLKNYCYNLLEKEKPDILGLSVYSGTLPASLFAAKFAKKMYPNIQVIVGGGIFSGELAINSPDYSYFLEKTPYIDKVIIGEGEKIFLEYLKGKLPRYQRVYTLKDINHENLELSTAGVPDFSDFDLEYYPQMASYTSRSCPYRCSFCVETTYWGKYRKKSAKKIVNELIELAKRYGEVLFLMCDSLLNPIINDLANELIEAKTLIFWGGYLRADKHVCEVDNTLLWRQGGFYRARLGVESGSQRILDLMNKRISIKQIRDAISSLAFAGIKTTTYWVIGYPGEREEDFQQTLKLVEELKDDIYEADCNAFWYFSTGQPSSRSWSKDVKSSFLYPENTRHMLFIQPSVLNCEPSREERFRRVNRFLEHCSDLGIPNPYTLHETQRADERWKKLHKNAVPSLLEIKSQEITIEESRNVRKKVDAGKILNHDGNWGF